MAARRDKSIEISSEKGVAGKGDTCVSCSVVVKIGEKGIQCEICDGWYHAKCENINDEGYKILQLENIHWYCNGCNKGIGKVIATIGKIQQRCDKMELELKDIQESMKFKQNKTEAEIGNINREIELQNREIRGIQEIMTEMSAALDKQNENQKDIESNDTLWSTIVGRHVERKMEGVTGEMVEMHKTIVEAKEHMEEEKNKERRRKNIIIYRVPESKASGPEVRKKEDLDFCRSLVQDNLGIEGSEEEFENVIRLGKRDDNICRPVLVQFKTMGIKNLVMESLGKLSNAEERFKRISITHDMTQKEREECKKMVEEANKRQQVESGEFVFRVRGLPGDLKIVKLKKRQLPAADHQRMDGGQERAPNEASN